MSSDPPAAPSKHSSVFPVSGGRTAAALLLQRRTSRAPSLPPAAEEESPSPSAAAPAAAGSGHASQLKLNAALNALSSSPDGEHVVVAGREVLKILRIQPREDVPSGGSEEAPIAGRHRITETLNLRAGSRLNLNTSSNDVKWCNQFSKHLIASAATNGAIVIWDVQKMVGQKRIRVITEHQRAVNRVSFHPSESTPLLLSGSQDGTMKIWDLRSADESAKFVLEGKSESVRDVQFHPVHQFEFAAAFENGTIQRWDIRNPRTFEKKLSAHNGLALTIDWHPDGRYLASGGRDRVIKFWDMESESRKPFHYIQTIASVARVQWRPNHSALIRQRAGAVAPEFSLNHIASCSLLTDSRVHVWNMDRPYLPFYSFDDHTNITTGLQWHDPQTIFSVGKDRMFVINEMPETATTTGATGTGFVPGDTMASVGAKWNVIGDVQWIGKVWRPDIPFDHRASQLVPSSSGFPTGTAANNSPSLETLAGNISLAEDPQRSLMPSNSVLTVAPSPSTSGSLAVSRGAMGSASRESLQKSLLKMEQLGNAATWNGSSVPNNFASILASISMDDTGIFEQRMSSKSSVEASSGTVVDETNEPARSSTMSYFSRKPKRVQSTQPPPISAPSPQRKAEIRLNLFHPSSIQRLGGSDSETFEWESFVWMALHYRVPRLEDAKSHIPIEEAISTCIHNAEVAAYAQQPTAHHGWKILRSVLEDFLTEWERYHFHRKESKFYEREPWDPRPSLSDGILTLIREGNVQMAVMIYLVLGDYVNVPLGQMEECFHGYIEILRRMQLHGVATELVKAAPFFSIRRLNQESTTIHTVCNHCFKPLLSSTAGYWYCERCKNVLGPCAVCHLPVKSSYTYCQGCGHGGHLSHLREWFRENRECPSGCGHQCTF